ncbi:hypothetical protein C2U70_07740 [Bradyrhizobium guangdongense]|uniref:hypothetical protein n=1 Tax=Bradyrhizobium guangdongense TaxID=1325090 RepID=UPI00112A7CFE|nr:hypothetical protein [Bradyrhizobium guangdongense]TPQ39110.1 hypothetical protein C2U70_07740 [Bradyrhizobium guangdongense]
MKSLITAIAGILSLATAAAAQAPVAIVEDVQGKVVGVEFMDLVAPGKVIKLGPGASVVLGYMKSCWRETITGGTAVVGAEQSMVHLSDVQRVKVECDVNAIKLSDREASQSAATTFRAMGPGQQAPTVPTPQLTLYGLSPVVEIKSVSGTLIIERVDVQGERYVVTIKKDVLLRGKFYDFIKTQTSLTPGGIYTASLSGRKLTFKIDSGAKAGPTPLIGRLLRM